MHKGIYKDKNGKWYIHTSYKGKSITIRGYDSKKSADDDYDYAIEKWKREHLYEYNEDVFDDVFFDYLESLENGNAPRTIDRERTQYNTYWKIVFHDQPLKVVYNFERLEIIYINIKNDEQLNIRKKHDLIKTFLAFTSFCYSKKLINEYTYKETKIIFQQMKYTKKVTNQHRIISYSQFKALIEDISHDNDNLFVLAVSSLYFGGFRLSELLAILGTDINLKERKIKVCKQLLTNGKLTDKLKTANSYREVPINTDLFKMFELIELKDERVFPYSHTDFRRKLKKYTDYTAHDFRHSCCYNLARKCETMSDVVYCAKCMGHSVSIYLNTYCSHLDSSLDDKFFN